MNMNSFLFCNHKINKIKYGKNKQDLNNLTQYATNDEKYIAIQVAVENIKLNMKTDGCHCKNLWYSIFVDNEKTTNTQLAFNFRYSHILKNAFQRELE